MKITNAVNPSMDSVIAHYGTKGMQWGVRKKKPTSAEIHGARNRQHARSLAARRAEDIATDRKASPKARAAAKARMTKIDKDWKTNEDRVTASRLTVGEKWALGLVTGPIGLGIIGLSSLSSLSTRNRVDEARAAASR